MEGTLFYLRPGYFCEEFILKQHGVWSVESGRSRLAELKDKRAKGLQSCVEQLHTAGHSKEGTPLQQSESRVGLEINPLALVPRGATW